MSWWVWLIIIVVIMIVVIILLSLLIGMADSGQSNKSRKPSKSAKQIADEVNTVAQYNALEKMVERADEKRQEYTAYDSRSQKHADRLDDKYQTLQKAFDIASKKILRWQFIPNFDIDTPYLILSNAYKLFSLAEYDEALLKLGNNNDEWYGLRGDDEPDEKDSEFIFVFEFSEIINKGGLSQDEKIKKINHLTSKNKEEAKGYFDLGGEITPGEQWYAKNT